jgi:Schlafen, AlbA_2
MPACILARAHLSASFSGGPRAVSDESPSSPSQTLASSYDALTREQIDQWVSARRIEDLYLDFSTSPKCFEARGERENLAKSISAFANAAGGLIVWGVRATKDADDVDAAQEVEPIRDRVKFLANLTGYSGVCSVTTCARASEPHDRRLGRGDARARK